MLRKPVFYIIGLALFVLNLIFFARAYNQLTHYSKLISRNTRVLHHYQQLSGHLHNAAIVNPELTNATRALKLDSLFYSDSPIVHHHLSQLISDVRDPVNIRIAGRLKKLVDTELPWLLNSDVPDSILPGKGIAHIISFVETIQRCFDLGVNSYIVNPVNSDQFAQAIQQLGFYWLLLNEPPE